MMRLSLCPALVAAAALCGGPVHAQSCSTCVTPTVAYAPVVPAATTVSYTPYNGWYPGRLLDTWRMRRWANNAVPTTVSYAPAVPTYTAAYAPYTAAYAPTYAAAYAPTYTAAYSSYTAAYAPYVTAYAPLQSPVVQTVAYAPTAAVSACNTCATPVTASYAPAVVAAPACDACTSCMTPSYAASPVSYAAPASGCSSCTDSAAAAVYTAPATTSPYSVPATGLPASDPITPQPQLDVPAPSASGYAPSGSGSSALDPIPADDSAGSSSYLEAPQLLNPNGDRTANRPSVDVWTAVYRKPVTHEQASATTASRASSRAEADAAGWTAVPTAH